MILIIKSNYKCYKGQLRFDWCRYSDTNNIMPFDFGITDKKILIELDGEQHFSQDDNYDWKDILKRIINYLENQQYCLAVFISYETKYMSHIQKLDSSINYKIVNPKNLEL